MKPWVTVLRLALISVETMFKFHLVDLISTAEGEGEVSWWRQRSSPVRSVESSGRVRASLVWSGHGPCLRDAKVGQLGPVYEGVDRGLI
ncbi:hypothetical protein L2E82_28008 [Cichorium intybus]|uniref:Uncharacterized protein n=1 Tax=Cichorium intybus TaxID=13427 RepID=A0ACB9CUV2_CICIN|nr:hypothetical protein L2E82_28008 [Cichorium intybus]